MKKYFGKCVIERPRAGSSASSRKARSFGNIKNTEDGPEYFGETKLPMAMNGRANGYESKSFTDVLGPIRNFLRKNCGRHWDDVYSEIKKTLGKAPWPVQHILKDHLNVERPWRGTDGRLYTWGYSYNVGPLEITRYYHPEHYFYVEPETGILRDGLYYKKRHPEKVKPQKALEKIEVDKDNWYEKIEGVWYVFSIRHFTTRIYQTNCADGLPRWVDRPDNEVSKRQLNKKELTILRKTYNI